MRGGKRTYTLVSPKPFVLLPIVGLVIAGLAVLFSQITGKGTDEILFSGQDQLPGLVSAAGTYSVGALALIVGFKGIAYSLSLGSFRGGPTFPVMFIGAAAGIMASHLPGFHITAAVAVGMSAGVVSVLRLPLTAVVVAIVLTANSGVGAEPLVIVGVVVAYVVTLLLSRRSSEPAAVSS
jgi:H+/Cl- antiporter ClcA